MDGHECLSGAGMARYSIAIVGPIHNANNLAGSGFASGVSEISRTFFIHFSVARRCGILDPREC